MLVTLRYRLSDEQRKMFNISYIQPLLKAKALCTFYVQNALALRRYTAHRKG